MHNSSTFTNSILYLLVQSWLCVTNHDLVFLCWAAIVQLFQQHVSCILIVYYNAAEER